MNTIPGLHDSFTEEGYWWITNNERKPGKLIFDKENGLSLEILGNLESSFDPDMKTIYGVTKNGKSITLFRSFRIRWKHGLQRIAEEVWISNRMVSGPKIDSEDQKIFTKSYFRFENIEEWLGSTPILIERDAQKNSLTVKVDTDREEDITECINFSIKNKKTSAIHETPTGCTIHTTTFLSICASSPQTIEWHLNAAIRVQRLASICSGYFMPLLSLTLHKANEDQIPQDITESREAHIYFQMKPHSSETQGAPTPSIVSGKKLIEYNPLSFQKWLEEYEKLAPVIGLFIIAGTKDHGFSHTRFLLAIQALEAFHRRTSDETIMPKAEFDEFSGEMKGLIPDTAPKKMKEKLNDTYCFLNEISFRQRLKSISKNLSEYLGEDTPIFTKKYRNKLINTRNYYTHFSEKFESKTLDGFDMDTASRQIIMILRILFLQRLGVPGPDILHSLKHHKTTREFWKLKES